MSPAFGASFVLLVAATFIWLRRNHIAERDFQRAKRLREKILGPERERSDHPPRPLDSLIGIGRLTFDATVPASRAHYYRKARVTAIILSIGAFGMFLVGLFGSAAR